MKYREITKEELLKEIEQLKHKIAELEKPEKERIRIKPSDQPDSVSFSESEEKYRSIFEGAYDGIVCVDKNLNIENVNPAFKEITGISNETVIGKTGFELAKKFVNIKQLPQILDLISNAFTNKPIKPYELKYQDKILEISSKTQKNGQTVGIIRDITRRKQAEEEIINSEKKFRALTENSPIGIYYNDLNGTFLFGNKKAEEIVGFNQDELIGKNFLKLKLLTPKGLLKAVKILALNNLGKSTGPDHFTLNTKNGTQKQVEISTTIINIEGQKVVLGMVQDITKSKHFEDALRSSEERLKIIYEFAPDAIFLGDLKGTVLDGNRAAEDMIGYKKEELVGTNIFKLKITSREDFPKIAKALAKSALGKKTGPDEFFVNRKDGSQILVEISTFPTQINDKSVVLGIARDITKRKQVETALRESEEKYRSLFEQSADAILIIEGDMFVDCNTATIKMLGYSTRDELLNTHPSQLSPELQSDGRNSFEKADEMMAIAYDKGSHRFEWNHMRQNGKVFPVEVLLTAVPIGNDKFLHVVWRDITDRKKAEEALIKSEKQYRNIFEKDISGVFLSTPEGKIIDFNPAFAKMIGYSSAEIMKMNTTKLYPSPTDRKEFLNKLTKNKTLIDLEIDLVRKDGQVIHCIENVVGDFNRKGELVQFQGYLMNITERKKAEEALFESEAKYRSLIEGSNDAIYLLYNRKFEITNNRFLEMLGYSMEEMSNPGFDFIHLVAPKSRQLVENRQKSIVQGKPSAHKYELTIITKTGKEIEVEASVSYIDYKDGIATQGILRDITERKRQQEIMMNAIVNVQEVEKHKFGKELHDGLGQILTSASLYIESLRKVKNKLPEDKHTDLEQIRHLNKQAISDVRRISHGLMITGINEHDIKYLIKQICYNSSTSELSFSFEHNNFDEERIKKETKVHLYRIAQELSTNILRHSKATQAKICLTMMKDEVLQLSVTDNGKGFSPDKEKKGAGLNNIKHRIAILKGNINIVSSKREGTSITVSIPL